MFPWSGWVCHPRRSVFALWHQWVWSNWHQAEASLSAYSMWVQHVGGIECESISSLIWMTNNYTILIGEPFMKVGEPFMKLKQRIVAWILWAGFFSGNLSLFFIGLHMYPLDWTLVIPPLIKKPDDGYINPYYWVFHDPLPLGSNNSWSPLSHMMLIKIQLPKVLWTSWDDSPLLFIGRGRWKVI